MATTMFMPPLMMKYDPSPEPYTTRESFIHQTQPLGSLVLPLVDHRLQPVVLFLPVEFRVQEQGVMILVPIHGCLMPLMPSSTASQGQRMLLIHLSNHQGIILETVVCLIARISYLMTTMDIPHNTPAIALALPHQ